jgi:glycine betaine catabolism A
MTAPPAPLDPAAVAAVIAPVGRARTLPAAAYIDPDVFAWEQRWFFDHAWVCIGRTSDMPAPGDQRALTVGTSGVLLVRDHTGDLAVFANACRHRGHELLPCGADTTSRTTILCPYHGWVYDLDGGLRSAPRFGDHESFVREEVGLVRLRSEEYGGWTFVNVSGTAAPLLDALGNLADVGGAYPLDDLVVGASHRYELAANWKIAQENYHECYHCPLIHPELVRISPPDSGDAFDDHRGAWVGGTMDLIDEADTMSLDGRSGGEVFESLRGTRLEREIIYAGVFPNLLISLHPDYVMTHRMEPLGPDRTRVECQWLFAPEVAARPDFDPSYAVDFWDLTNRQDWAAVESVQRGLGTPGWTPGWFAKFEDDVWRFANLVARGYQGRDVTTIGRWDDLDVDAPATGANA